MDPARASFLYRRILEIDREYENGRAHELFNLAEERLKPRRLAYLRTLAQAAIKVRDWHRGMRIGQDMLALDANNANAKRLISVCANRAK